MRQDTTWIDSLTVDTIVERQYTHYLPDDVLLRAFKELSFSQRFLKAERLTPEKFSLYFTAPADTLPLLKGLNFNEGRCVCYRTAYRPERYDSLLDKGFSAL